MHHLIRIAVITIPSVVLFGKLLDGTRWSPRRKAWTAMMTWLLPQIACFIWVAFEYHVLPNEVALDPKL
jgi:hypothetical protein